MPVTSRNRRKILCVSPAYSPSFGTFEYAYPLRGGHPRLHAAAGHCWWSRPICRREWEVRFVDENIAPARDRDFAWADAVFVSGMHVQREQILSIAPARPSLRQARGAGRAVGVGRSSAYPEFDYLHIGELGDATDRLIALIDADPRRPAAAGRCETQERLPLTEFPVPAYHLAEIERYFLGSVQFSSGCPYRCEFCDIPGALRPQSRA